jgi:peptidyl-prolyl cis-trans isomerase D
MLKVMRDSFQHLKWILVLVIAVFILGFVLIDTGLQGGAPTEAGYAAKVNGETVPISEFNRSLFFANQQYQSMYGQQMTPEMLASMGIPRRVMDSLIDETLLLQEARELGLAATDEEIRKEILEIPVLNPGGKFVGTELYQTYVRDRLGYPSAAAFERVLARGITLRKMENALQSAVVVTPQQAEEEFRRRNENVKIRYALYPAERALTTVSVTPAEVEAYYRANSSRYAHPQQKNVKYLLADLARIRAEINLTDAQLRERYQQNREQYRTGEAVQASHILIKTEENATPQQIEQARTKANALLQQIRGGADFATLARQNSGDPSSAANGGDLGFFESGQMVPEFEQTAFAQNVGEVSEPVKTQYGFHIIKTTAKRPSGYRSFEEVRSEIQPAMIDETAKAQARDRINRVLTQLRANQPKSEADLRALANEYVSFNDAGWFGKNDAIEGLGRMPQLNAWAFGAETGALGEVMETQRGFLVPYLVGSREAGISPLAEIRERVENDARLAKAREVAKGEIQKAMSGGADLTTVASNLGVTAVEATVSREGFVTGLTGALKPLVNQAFQSKVGQRGGPVVVDQGALAFEVTEKTEYDPAQFTAQKEFLIDQLRRRASSALRVSLLAKLRKDADVTVNSSLLGSDAAAQQNPQPAV